MRVAIAKVVLVLGSVWNQGISFEGEKINNLKPLEWNTHHITFVKLLSRQKRYQST
jgi:hypothetical protein